MLNSKLTEQWQAAGIAPGDVVLLHSNLQRVFRRCLQEGCRVTPEQILESFLAAVGPHGTLLLPLFNFDFTQGFPFDIRHTPSQMGALTEAGRQHPLAVRTGHPIYSFAVLGHLAESFQGVDNHSGYGSDSPFALLRQWHGKIAILDLPDQNSMTFYHHVEEMLEVDYRYHKQFTANYTDQAGTTQAKTYSLFVRNLERGVRTCVDPAGERLWAEGLYLGDRPHSGSGLRTIHANAMYDFVADLIRAGKAEGLLYRIEDPAHA
jgi:aminoglycoside 3-N-acetyltransferase